MGGYFDGKDIKDGTITPSKLAIANPFARTLYVQSTHVKAADGS